VGLQDRPYVHQPRLFVGPSHSKLWPERKGGRLRDIHRRATSCRACYCNCTRSWFCSTILLTCPSLQLKGKITTITTYRGAISSNLSQKLLSRTITVYASYLKNSGGNLEHKFNTSFPASIHTESGTAKLPPSASIHLLNVHCDVAYTIRIDMVRKGLRRHESYGISSLMYYSNSQIQDRKVIPILYLPKSTPLQYPLSGIPRSLGRMTEPPIYASDHIKTVKLTALWKRGTSPDKSKSAHVSILQ
jgi:hypothetical protein